MRISHAVLTFHMVNPLGGWRADWAWGVPLIVLTVVIHVLGLNFISQKASQVFARTRERRHPTVVFVVVLGIVTLLATALHGVEAFIWAGAYRLIGALPDEQSAMLYSMSAMTSYGHANLNLASHWQLMGAVESLNGWLLFGLTTAVLFGMIQKVWQLRGD